MQHANTVNYYQFKNSRTVVAKATAVCSSSPVTELCDILLFNKAEIDFYCIIILITLNNTDDQITV